MDPGSPYGQLFYARILAYNERTAEACSLLDRLSRDAPQTGFGRLAPFLKAALEHDRVAALEAVANSEKLTRLARSDDLHSWWMAECYSLIGHTDEALQWVENMVRRGGFNYPVLSKLDTLTGQRAPRPPVPAADGESQTPVGSL